MPSLEALRARAERGSTPGERAAARRALEVHERKQRERRAEVVAGMPAPEPAGPGLTRSGGRPYAGRLDSDGRVWVACRVSEGEARGWVSDRRRMLVRLDGERWGMVPVEVEGGEDSGQVWVTAPRESFSPWT